MEDTEEIKLKINPALKQRFQIKCAERRTKMSPVLRDFIQSWCEADSNESTSSNLAAEFLKKVAAGETPDNREFVALAAELGISTRELMKIKKSENGVKNGI
ncbi:MAG: hypothetical protein KME06_09670 [Kastovskya adunca ATA6-11-RM4]|jgi:hypothetical protein|nr:hypothetical protein [Kastovskya adunca ATA6-11-RM4]